MSHLRAICGKVLVRPIVDEYKGRIVIPATVKKDPVFKGLVLSVGPGVLLKNGERWPIGCRVGDVILFEKDAGKEVLVDGEKLRVIRDDSIVAVLE